jgi:hypothetical protein
MNTRIIKKQEPRESDIFMDANVDPITTPQNPVPSFWIPGSGSGNMAVFLKLEFSASKNQDKTFEIQNGKSLCQVYNYIANTRFAPNLTVDEHTYARLTVCDKDGILPIQKGVKPEKTKKSTSSLQSNNTNQDKKRKFEEIKTTESLNPKKPAKKEKKPSRGIEELDFVDLCSGKPEKFGFVSFPGKSHGSREAIQFRVQLWIHGLYYEWFSQPFVVFTTAKQTLPGPQHGKQDDFYVPAWPISFDKHALKTLVKQEFVECQKKIDLLNLDLNFLEGSTLFSVKEEDIKVESEMNWTDTVAHIPFEIKDEYEECEPSAKWKCTDEDNMFNEYFNDDTWDVKLEPIE